MFGFGPVELVIILVIVIILFGPGRLGKTMGELGSGIRSLKEGLSGEKKDDDQSKPPAGDDK
jgi:sec-independent protein translocase protein TatA